VPDPLEGGQRFLIGARQRMQVPLRGLDLAVPEAVHDRLEVRATGE